MVVCSLNAANHVPGFSRYLVGLVAFAPTPSFLRLLLCGWDSCILLTVTLLLGPSLQDMATLMILGGSKTQGALEAYASNAPWVPAMGVVRVTQ